ncbi:MAG: DUF4097 family beta strand repeat protein [Clostridia bacterium]|nr:DUF4097 family beta strand repeat protein [Clostridia bacterium]
MDNKFHKWFIIAGSLIVIGLLIVLLASCGIDWDFSKLGTSQLITNTYEIQDEFVDISVITATADVILLPSTDGTCRVECIEDEKQKHSVSVVSGVLTVNAEDNRKWYDFISLFFRKQQLKIYLTEKEYSALFIKTKTGAVELPKDFFFASINVNLETGSIQNRASASGEIRIKASTGDIFVEGVSASSMDLSVSTGKITVTDVACSGNIGADVSTGKCIMTNVSCANFDSEGSTGAIQLSNVIVSEKLSVERNTGDITFERCDAAEISMETDTGDIKGSLLSEKIFFAKTDTGRVDVPKTSSGGRCEIETDTGNIRITIVE